MDGCPTGLCTPSVPVDGDTRHSKLNPSRKPSANRYSGKMVAGIHLGGQAVTAPGTIGHATLERPRVSRRSLPTKADPLGHFPDGLRLALAFLGLLPFWRHESPRRITYYLTGARECEMSRGTHLLAECWLSQAVLTKATSRSPSITVGKS